MLSHCVKLEYRVNSRNILEGTVIKLWTGRSGAGFLSGTKIFIFSEMSIPTMRPNQVLLIVTGGSSQGVKQPEREVYYSSASSVNVDNKWNWPPPPAPVRLRGVDRDKFTFISTFYVPRKLRYTCIHSKGASNGNPSLLLF
jgi:hypothetical protein